ncbi:MAG: chemotaxis protein CheD [Gallionellaceae bacterium]|nr:MAG: chemotaxis protein CheD [Gallionellaceae bacterium]
MSQDILQAAGSAEIYLLPGDFHFGGKNTRIRTVLGSCVSIAVWHPLLCIGGMSHSLLPSRGKPGNTGLDGRYADEAIGLFLHEIGKRNTRPAEYQVKLFGGGNMFLQANPEKVFNVAGNNIETARAILKVGGFGLHAEHVGGSGHRSIIFDLRDGSVSVKHGKFPESAD